MLESNRLRIETAADAVAASGAAKITLLGLSFKRGTDDVRESPYVLLAELMVGRGLEVSASSILMWMSNAPSGAEPPIPLRNICPSGSNAA